MASIYKRGKKWWAQWYLADGKRVARATGSEKKREAERIAAGFEAADRKAAESQGDIGRALRKILDTAGTAAQNGQLNAKRAEDILIELRKAADPNFRVVTLDAFLSDWVTEQSLRVAAKTAAGYKDMHRRMKRALGPAAMRAPLGDLTKDQVRRAVHKLHSGELRASTVNLDLRALRQALRHAVDDGMISTNPAAGVKALPQTDSTKRVPFTAAEVRALLDHPKTSDEWRGLILLAAHTGLRLGDVVGLGSENVDGIRLVIRPQKTSRTGKVISVPLTPPCLAWIEGKKGPFFPDARKVAIPTLSMQFAAIMKRSGVTRSVKIPGDIEGTRSFHSLRHSFASWLAEGDIHSDVRQKLTGHSSAGMHARYTHHDEALDRAITVLPDFGLASGG